MGNWKLLFIILSLISLADFSIAQGKCTSQGGGILILMINFCTTEDFKHDKISKYPDNVKEITSFMNEGNEFPTFPSKNFCSKRLKKG
jgi:hypothetical protein